LFSRICHQEIPKESGRIETEWNESDTCRRLEIPKNEAEILLQANKEISV
jgi:hypothetical protein